MLNKQKLSTCLTECYSFWIPLDVKLCSALVYKWVLVSYMEGRRSTVSKPIMRRCNAPQFFILRKPG